MRDHLKRWLPAVAKAAVSVGLIWLALRTTDLASIADRAAALPVWLIMVFLGLVLLQALVATARWWLVARADGIPLAPLSALRILWIGLFFNQTLPSSVGGDVFRIWLLHRRGTTLGRATGNVLLDRVIGLLALLLTSIIGLPVLFSTMSGPAPWSILGVCVTGIVGFGVLLVLGGRWGRWLDRWRLASPVRAAGGAARHLVSRPAAGAVVLVLSVGIHLLTVLVVALLLDGFGQPMPFLLLLALVPPVMLVAVVPISMAGWGLREGAMVMALGFVGVPPADALAASLFIGVGMFLVGLPGGVIWLMRSHWQRPAAVAEELPGGGQT